jgi:hypothetical protein
MDGDTYLSDKLNPLNNNNNNNNSNKVKVKFTLEEATKAQGEAEV